MKNASDFRDFRCIFPSIDQAPPTMIRMPFGSYIDLFDELNRMIASNLPYRLWLLRYNRKHLRFSHFSVSRPLHLPTTISFDLSGAFRPIKCANSNRDVHSAIASLVVEHQVKMSPIVESLKPPFSASINYH